MRAIAQGQAALLPSYRRPVSSTSLDHTEFAVVVIWSLLGLAVAAFCNLSEIYAGMGDLLAFAG